MRVLYAKAFEKDLDGIRHDAQMRRRVSEIIERLKQAGSLSEIRGVRSITGYAGYYRIRAGDYRMGLKLSEDAATLVRLLHRKDIYRRFP